MCLSARKEYVEEMLRDQVPLNIISGRMREVYDEQISSDALARHRANHMSEPHSNNDRVREVEKEQKRGEDETRSDKLTAADTEEEAAEDPLSKLEARVNALEIVLAEEADPSQYTGFTSYTIAGARSHQISYKDIVSAAMPDKKGVHEQYKALVASIKAKIVKDGGLILSDESFIGPRAKLLAEETKRVKLAIEEAEADLRQREQERKKFQAQMTQLVERERRSARQAT